VNFSKLNKPQVEKTMTEKPKSTMQIYWENFKNFKKSPILNAISNTARLIPSDDQLIAFISGLPYQAKEYLKNKDLERLADTYSESGLTDQYLKYATRKMILRDEIQSLAVGTGSTPEIKNDELSYLYGKYERFLCDNVRGNGAMTIYISKILHRLSLQKTMQDKVKNMDKNEFLDNYFPGVKYEGDLPEFEIEILPLAVNIKTPDYNFVQNLYSNKILDKEECSKIGCGGFFNGDHEFNILVEHISTYIGTDTETHELFHAEMKLQNPNKTVMAKNQYSLKDNMTNWDEDTDIEKQLKEFYTSINMDIIEEVMAFFSEPNHEFDGTIFNYYLDHYGIRNGEFDIMLNENTGLTTWDKAGIQTSYSQMEKDLKSSIFEFRDALQIMHQKGYPKAWILNSFSSVDNRPVFLENTNPKALALSLPIYDPQKTEKQRKTFDKISERHQRKLELLKQNIELSSKFTEDFDQMFLKKEYFNQKGVYVQKFNFKSFIYTIKNGTPVDELLFGDHIQEILQKYGDTQATRQAIVAKLTQEIDEAKEKYAVAIVRTADL
jgi:hypothetical protein